MALDGLVHPAETADETTAPAAAALATPGTSFAGCVCQRRSSTGRCGACRSS